jgi:polysaccharide export outer membrane protein
MPAGGLTVPELTQMVNREYARFIPDMRVSVVLQEVVGNLVFVDGEVARPGVFTTRGPTTVQHAIALAGGTTNTAEPRTVLVISRGPQGNMITRVTDLTRMSSSTDLLLNRNDLVYVPKTTIARANVWVEQNIKNLLMFTGWSLGVTSDLGRITTR